MSISGPRSSKVLEEPYLLNDTWLITGTIGSGSFGKIFAAKDVNSDQKVAIKITNLLEAQVQQLRIENDVLNRLKQIRGVSRVHYFGRSFPDGAHFCLVMDYLGPNLEDLFRYCGNGFSMKTLCMLAVQMLMRIEVLHSNQIIHRDIKPDNFTMGRGPNFNLVNIIDFGLSRSYIIPGTDEHIPFVQTRRMMGTARYCSLNSHMGLQLSRRDDIESLGYIFIYFAKGSLPWQGITAGNRIEKFRMIHQKKSSISPTDLCEGLPEQFVDYITEAKSLTFAAEPNYSHLRSHFYSIMAENNLHYDNEFDWLTVYDQRVQYGIAFTAPKES